MAWLLRTLLICVCVSASRVWSLEYRSSWYGPPLNDNIQRFTLLEKSLTECLNACALRPWCKVVGYHRYGLCEIFFENISSDATQRKSDDYEEHDQSMMFIRREDLLSKDKAECDDTCPYDSTKPLQRCDLTSEKCPIDVCPPFKDHANGKVIGNTHEEGHKRRLLCNHGYLPLDPNNVTSECQNGRWTSLTTCVQDCPIFITPKHGTVDGNGSGVGATRILKWDNGYLPLEENRILSVCDNSIWSGIIRCVPDNCVYPAFEFNQSIYLLTNLSAYFDTAADLCTGCDGHVITIDDEDEQEWVTNAALNSFAL